jgi:hypothetical protein
MVAINLNNDELVSVNPHEFLSNQSAAYLTHFTRQQATNDTLYSNYLMYYNNSEMVGQAMKTAYVDNSSLDDQDHIGWAKVAIQVFKWFGCVIPELFVIKGVH